MNKIERLIGFKSQARVRYKDGEFEVDGHGDFVRCAVTGAVIPLTQLKYWSVALQEPYATPAASLQREMERRRR